MAQSSELVDARAVNNWAAQSAPAREASAVTPSDTVTVNFRALYVGTAGNLAVVPVGGDAAVTFTNVPVGWFPVSVSKVMSTNTTATGIIGVR